MHPLYDALPAPYAPVCDTRAAGSHIYILMRLLAAKPRSIARLLFPYPVKNYRRVVYDL